MLFISTVQFQTLRETMKLFWRLVVICANYMAAINAVCVSHKKMVQALKIIMVRVMKKCNFHVHVNESYRLHFMTI